MRLRRCLLYIWLAGHLGLAVRLNLASTGLWPFQLADRSVLAGYVRVTGLICTYGFFSPQVASPCFLEMGLAGGEPQTQPHYLSFVSHEARLRFHSFSTKFLDLAPAAGRREASGASPFQERMAKAFAHSVAEREAARQGKQLQYLRVIVYRHPALVSYRPGQTGTLHTLYENKF